MSQPNFPQELSTIIFTCSKFPFQKYLNYIFQLAVLKYRGQFHQHFMRAFFVWKCFAQLFSRYVLAKRHFCMKNARVKCWWNVNPLFFFALRRNYLIVGLRSVHVGSELVHRVLNLSWTEKFVGCLWRDSTDWSWRLNNRLWQSLDCLHDHLEEKKFNQFFFWEVTFVNK